MTQGWITVGVGVLAVNVLVLAWLIVQMGSLQKGTKQAAKRASNQILSGAEKHHLQESLQQKTETAATAASTSFERNLEAFSKQLEDSLLSQASGVFEQQLAEAKRVVGAFNSSINEAATEAAKTLAGAAQASQAQLDQQVITQRQLLVDQFEQHMAAIISAYLVAALGEEAADDDQTSRVLQVLEAHRDDLRKDMLG